MLNVLRNKKKYPFLKIDSLIEKITHAVQSWESEIRASKDFCTNTHGFTTWLALVSPSCATVVHINILILT